MLCSDCFFLFCAGGMSYVVFFFQAEDGIRDGRVTGAQTCALPISKQPQHARAFYGTIAIATMGGVLLNFLPVDPIRALFLSAVVNGIVAAPVMAIIMLMATRKRIMGRFVIGRGLQIFGWTATAVMAAASAAMVLAAIL